jgi:glycosyltransferase involved in cell wall biosynthesis
MKKNLLFITKYDIKSPQSGGSGILIHNILKRITNEYDITVLSSAFPACETREIIDDITYIRLGSKRIYKNGVYNWKIYFWVFQYYAKHLSNKRKQFDIVVEHIHSLPFFYSFYGDSKTILFVSQLQQKNWFHKIPWFIAWIPFLFESIYLFFLRNRRVITTSESAKKALMASGFKKENIHIISEGISIVPISILSDVKKYRQFTMLSFGKINEMKRTHHHIKAFECAKKYIPELQLKIAGANGGAYGEYLLKLINNSPYAKDIKYLGSVTKKKKIELMQKSSFIVGTSEQEAWGITISEANSQGTPAIVYDVDGLRDNVIHNETGIICEKNTPEILALEINKLYQNRNLYKRLQYNAWNLSKKINFERAAYQFYDVITTIPTENKETYLRLRRFRYVK